MLDWREGDVTAIDTETALTTKGDVASPGALKVSGTIRKIILAVGFGPVLTASTLSGGACFARIRGSGGALMDLPIGGHGGNVTTSGGAATSQEPIVYNVELPWNGEMLVFGEFTGVDLGTMYVAVFLYGTP